MARARALTGHRVFLFARALPLCLLLAMRAGRAQEFTIIPFGVNGSPVGIASGFGQDLWISTSFTRAARVSFDGTVLEQVTAPRVHGLLRQGDRLWGADVSSFLWMFGGDRQLATFPYAGVVADGEDGTIWLFGSTSLGGYSVGVFHLAPDGTEVARFPLPAGVGQGTGIAKGPDGNLWMVEGFDKVLRMTPSGQFTVFHTPTPYSFPRKICSGSDGNLWLSEYFWTPPDGVPYRSRIGRITPSGVMTEFVIPSEWNGPQDMHLGSDGNVWFTEFFGKMGRITPQGQITEFPFPIPVLPYHFTLGADGAWWITTGDANLLIRMTIPSGGPAPQLTDVPTLPAWALAVLVAALGLGGALLLKRA